MVYCVSPPLSIISVIFSPTIHVFRVPLQHHISHLVPHHSCISRSPPTSYQSPAPPPFMYFAFPSNIISVIWSPTIHVFRFPLQHHISHLVPHHSCISRPPPNILSVIFSLPIHVFLVPLQHHISRLLPHHSCISPLPPTTAEGWWLLCNGCRRHCVNSFPSTSVVQNLSVFYGTSGLVTVPTTARLLFSNQSQFIVMYAVPFSVFLQDLL